VAPPEAERIEGIAALLRDRLGEPPEVAAVLGSGWREAVQGILLQPESLPLEEIPDWPLPRVAGHGTALTEGRCRGRRAILVGGRVHAYEGFKAREIVRGVRALAAWGVPAFVLLNAAGSVDSHRRPGSLMVWRDHLNFRLPNPLVAPETPDGQPVFLDLSDLYDPAWRKGLFKTCPVLRTGVYAGLLGPSYETPAEVHRLRVSGADAVGMSTIPEALAARAAGGRVLAMSLLTNLAAGIGLSRPSHQEVLAMARIHAPAARETLCAALECAPKPD